MPDDEQYRFEDVEPESAENRNFRLFLSKSLAQRLRETKLSQQDRLVLQEKGAEILVKYGFPKPSFNQPPYAFIKTVESHEITWLFYLCDIPKQRCNLATNSTEIERLNHEGSPRQKFIRYSSIGVTTENLANALKEMAEKYLEFAESKSKTS